MGVFLDECDYLIHLVRCGIHNTQPEELPQGLDFQRVYEWGAYHHVANIAFYALEKLKTKPQDSLYAKWEADRNRAVIRDMNQCYAAEEIRTAFREGAIRSLEMQGTKIKPLYPQSDYRTMSDIDFVVEPENMAKAKEILENLGYQCKIEHGVEVVAFRPPNIHVEVHTEYFAHNEDFRSILPAPFTSPEANSISEFYLYNILHIAKHYLYGGCGIRRVLDVYYLNRNYGDIIDSDYVASLLEKAKVSQLAAELTVLANAWFGEGEQVAVDRDVASYVTKSGVHGHRANERNNRLKKLEGSKGEILWKRFWGTKQILRKSYPILERHKILYPFCWMHRALRALHPRKMKGLVREVKAVLRK